MKKKKKRKTKAKQTNLPPKFGECHDYYDDEKNQWILSNGCQHLVRLNTVCSSFSMQLSLLFCAVVVFVSPADFAKNLIASDELERLYRRRLLLMAILVSSLVSCFYYTFDLLFVYVHLVFYFSHKCSQCYCYPFSSSPSHSRMSHRHCPCRRSQSHCHRLGCHYRCCTRLSYYIAYCLHRCRDCLLLYIWHRVCAPLWCTMFLFRMIYALLDVCKKRNSIKLTRTVPFRW